MNEFGTRYYDPSVGRCTQQDSVAGSIGNPGSVNLYAYVGNDPVNFVDPTGYSLSSRLEHAYKTGARFSRRAAIVGAAVGCVTGGIGGAAGGSVLEPGGGTVGGAIAGCLVYGARVGSDASAIGFVVGYGVGFVRDE